MGIGDWGLGIGSNPQFPIPNTQSPIPIKNCKIKFIKLKKIGEWGSGHSGLGVAALAQCLFPNPQSPIPNPQSPIPNFNTK